MNAEERYRIGLAALQFFCLEAAEQIKSRSVMSGVSQPVFFSVRQGQDHGCDYFFGVACVFKTYGGMLYEKFLSEEEADCLQDFSHRLNLFMQDGTAAEWSETGIVDGETWKRLRVDARKAIDQLGECVPKEACCFDVEALIDPNEFRSSEQAMSLLQAERPK